MGISRFRRFFHVDRGLRGVRRSIDEELSFHFHMSVRQLMEQGLTPEAARQEALRRFGDVARTIDRLSAIDRDRTRLAAGREAWGSLVQDVRYAARSLVTHPGFAGVVALTLALGIGATTTMFGIVDRLLLRGPDHVADAGSLRRMYAHVRSRASGEFTTSFLGYAAYVAARDHTRSFSSVAAYATQAGTSIGRGLDAEQVRLGLATYDFFPSLGVRPVVGRFFTAAEDRPPEGAHVVVLDYGYWQRAYAGSDSVLGHTVLINQQPFTIIGVAPRGFTGVELQATALWIPMSAGPHPTSDWWSTWRAQWLNVVVRLKPGVTDDQAAADLTSAFRGAYTGTDEEWKVADLSGRPISFDWNGNEPADIRIARWLAAVAIIVLIIACANVANLLLARAIRRHREIAVRLALGAGRARLVRLLMTEGLLYAMVGGAAGVALAYGGGELMRRVFLSNVAWMTRPVDERVLVVSLLLTVTAGVAVSLAPIVQFRRTDIAAVLRDAGQGTPSQNRLRAALLVAQAALSVVLLVGAGLFVRSLANVHALNLGVEPDRVLVADVYWPRLTAADSSAKAAAKAREAAVWRTMRDRLVATKDVEHAALAIGSPFGFGFGVGVRVPGRDSLPNAPSGGPYVSAVSGDYFSTVGTPLVAGRAFGLTEGATTERVAIVNETMARLLWPGADPLGKCLIIGDHETRCSIVVGVVRDARRYQLREKPSMQYYIPFGQEGSDFGGTVLLVRPRGEARAFTGSLRRTVAALVPDASRIDVSAMQDRVDPLVRPWRLGAAMFGLFGGLALLVAALGLYSGFSYVVAQRTREFGVRLAIGADGARIMREVLRDGLRLSVLALLIGGGVALAPGRFVEPLLFNESPRDVVVFGGVAVVLIVMAVLASAIPARRAARVDPLVALHAE